jgi:hypothetical protein
MSNKSKIEKEMPEFVAEVSGLCLGDLETRLVALSKGVMEVERTKEADEAYAAAKANASELGAPYREAKKALKMKMEYIFGLLGESEKK